MTDYLILPLTFVLSFVTCRLVIHFSRKLQWLDKPNARSSHVVPTPTAGGLAIVLIFVLAILFAFRQQSPGFNHYLVLALSVMVASMGFVDDLLNLGIASRITIQLAGVVGAILIFGIPEVIVIFDLQAPGWLTAIVTILALLWFINLFNFMDGIDGNAGSEAVFICLALHVIIGFGSIVELALILAAAVSGFLVLNWAPARIFMGDTGSNFLGYLLGVIMLALAATGLTTVWTGLILGGTFIIDASCTLLSRMSSRETWYHAHRSHAYQRAADYFASHGKVVLLNLLLNGLWLFPLAWLAHANPGLGLLLTLVAWLPLGILVYLARMLPVAEAVNQ